MAMTRSIHADLEQGAAKLPVLKFFSGSRAAIRGRKMKSNPKRFKQAIATTLVVMGFAWLIFEFAAQSIYLRPAFRNPRPALRYIWATPMKGRYAYLTHAESLLAIYTPGSFVLILGGAFWLYRIPR